MIQSSIALLAASCSRVMPKLKLSAFVFLLSVVLGTSGPDPSAANELKSWEKRQKRLKIEAIALFEAVLMGREQDVKRKPTSCEIRAEWFDYAVPQDIAEKYLGLTIPADLSPSDTPGKPSEILDPNSVMRNALCTIKEDDERLRSILENLKNSELKDEMPSGKSLRQYQNYRLEYSIPIFDQQYRRAVIMVSGQANSWWLRSDGKIGNGFDTGVWASIYVKRNGHWSLLREEPISSGHGGAPPQ